MRENVEAAATSTGTPVHATVPDLLLRHCLSLGDLTQPRRSARLRLEEAVGPELARRLLRSLTPSGRG
jgi:hypothetical protein